MDPCGEASTLSTTNFSGHGFNKFRPVATPNNKNAPKILPAKGR
jgi:hypothetical protein